MSEFHELFEKIGVIGESIKAVREDMSEIKDDIRNEIKPGIASYQRDRNILIGAGLGISALCGAVFGGIGKAIAKTLGNG